MREKKKAARLGTVLDKMVCNRDWQYRLCINKVFLFWEEIVGNEMASIATPEVVKGDVLWVNVPDSMWMQQLHLQKINLLDKLNMRLVEESRSQTGSSKTPVLEDIRFKIGRTERIEKKEVVEKKEVREIDPQRESEFDLLSRSIKDEELRDRIKRVWRDQEKRSVDTFKG